MLKSGVLMFPFWDLTFTKLQPADQSAVLISAAKVGFLILLCRCIEPESCDLLSPFIKSHSSLCTATQIID